MMTPCAWSRLAVYVRRIVIHFILQILEVDSVIYANFSISHAEVSSIRIVIITDCTKNSERMIPTGIPGVYLFYVTERVHFMSVCTGGFGVPDVKSISSLATGLKYEKKYIYSLFTHPSLEENRKY